MVRLQRAEKNLWRRLRRSCGLDATLHRGDDTGTVRVVPGVATSVVNGDEVAYTTREADFVSAHHEININGSLTQLQRHDVLEIFGQKFEILPANGERHWDPAGNYNYLIRIHTKWLEDVGNVYGVKDVNELFVRDTNGQFVIANLNAVAS